MQRIPFTENNVVIERYLKLSLFIFLVHRIVPLLCLLKIFIGLTSTVQVIFFTLMEGHNYVEKYKI